VVVAGFTVVVFAEKQCGRGGAAAASSAAGLTAAAATPGGRCELASPALLTAVCRGVVTWLVSTPAGSSALSPGLVVVLLVVGAGGGGGGGCGGGGDGGSVLSPDSELALQFWCGQEALLGDPVLCIDA